MLLWFSFRKRDKKSCIFRHTSKTIIIEKQSIENGIKIATEAITNIRTVASLSKQYNRNFVTV